MTAPDAVMRGASCLMPLVAGHFAPRIRAPRAWIVGLARHDRCNTVQGAFMISRGSHSGGLRILVADDDPEMRAWLRLALRPLATVPIEVGDGIELLEHLAETGTYDAVITDVRMPNVDGLRVVSMVRAAGLDTPILVITAFPEESLRSAVARLPGTALLAKPFDVVDLRRTIEQLVTAHQQGA